MSVDSIKVLVTGANGFIGKNLIETFKNISNGNDASFGDFKKIIVYEYDLDTPEELLDKYCAECNFVFNLAGINRPQNETEFMEGNFGFASDLLNLLKKHHNKCAVMISSSIQAELENPYGKSKRAGEELLIDYGKETGADVFIYRFPNVFGKWCRPNYNSAVATFCNNIGNDLPIQISDRSNIVQLVYIDDVVRELVYLLKGRVTQADGYCYVPVVYEKTLGEIVDLLYSFKESRKELSVPKMDDSFEKKLYSTYLSYLPKNEFSYPLKMNIDERGSFTEMIRTLDRGQFSVNISKPGITKGNHWHHTKNEKFVVVSGKGLIRFRKVNCDEIIEYHVSGDKIEVVDIPTGYTHSIVNVGDSDLVTFMWCNECFDPKHPDTYFLNVEEEE